MGMNRNQKFDYMLTRIGGFGKFQWISTSSFILGISFGFFYFFPSALLEAEPVIECQNSTTDAWYPCNYTYWCEDQSIEKRIVDDPTSLDNWVERVDGLDCASSTKKGWLGSSWFVGWVLSLIIIPRIADSIGRWILYNVGQLITLVTFAIVLACKDLNVMIVLWFFSGLATGIRMSMGYVYMQEFVPLKQQTIVGTLHLNCENIILLLATFYFQVISKHWFWFELFGFIITFLCSIVTLVFVPESPKFLIM